MRQLVATTAYFVFTDSLDPIKLIRPGLATAAAAPAVPSAIAVKAGWNLIPVLTYQSPLPGDPPGTGGVSADDYLGALRNNAGRRGVAAGPALGHHQPDLDLGGPGRDRDSQRW